MSGGSGEDFKAFEAEAWGAQAATYGELSGAITRRFAEPLLDAARVRHDQRVLDVATGPGYVAELAEHRGAIAVGLDLSEGMLAEARRNHPEIEFVAGDAEALPFPDERFDAVVGNFVINHLPAPERAAAEAVRVLVSGGRAAFSAGQRPERMLVMGLLAQAMEAAGVEADERAAGIPEAPDSYRFAEPGELRSVLEGGGLADVVVEPVEFTHEVAGTEDLWRGYMGGSARGATVVRAQPEEVQRRIREALDDVAAPYASGDGLGIPVAALIASGRRA